MSIFGFYFDTAVLQNALAGLGIVWIGAGSVEMAFSLTAAHASDEIEFVLSTGSIIAIALGFVAVFISSIRRKPT